MAKDKKSFLLYVDLIHTVEKLSDEKAGQLLKHILRYVNDHNPEPPDMLVEIVFEPIKQQLKRDLKKYEQKQGQWSDAGKKSAEARKLAKENLDQRPLDSSTSVEPPSTVSTVSVTDNVKGTVTVKEEKKAVVVPTTEQLKERLNERALKFKETIKPFQVQYDVSMLKEFYEYWIEPNKSFTKLRWELEKTWELSRRLGVWASRAKIGNSKGNGNDGSTLKKLNYDNA